MNDLSSTNPFFKLQTISFCGDRQYSIKLSRGSETIEAICEVRRIDGKGIESFDLVEFQSDEFNNLCTRGLVYSKPLGKAILAFHECIYSE